MKKRIQSLLIFFLLSIYIFSATVFVHAESMKDMNMGEASGDGDCMMSSGVLEQIDENSLDCIEMCVGDYDKYFVSRVGLENLRIFEKIIYVEENVFKEITVCIFCSDIDPPPYIGNVSKNEFHKIIVKIE